MTNKDITPEEWNAVHCVNGGAYKLLDKFISVETLNLQVDYVKTAKAYGYSHRFTSQAGNKLTESRNRDLIAAVKEIRAGNCE